MPRSPVSSPILVQVSPAPALPPSKARFSQLLLGIVREQDPNAELLYTLKNHTAGSGEQGNPKFLLDAKILRWRDAGTVYDGEPDNIEIDFQLIQLNPRIVIRELRFETRGSFLAIRDEPPERLLNDKFRRAVRQVVGAVRP